MPTSKKGESKRLTEARWKALFDEWADSGMRQKQFCKAKNLSFNTFAYWRSRLSEKKKQAASFQSVKIQPSSKELSAKQSINLRLPNGVSLVIPPTADKALLKNLFELLGVAAC